MIATIFNTVTYNSYYF